MVEVVTADSRRTAMSVLTIATHGGRAEEIEPLIEATIARDVETFGADYVVDVLGAMTSIAARLVHAVAQGAREPVDDILKRIGLSSYMQGVDDSAPPAEA